jgi:hypothetical protein
MSWLPDAVEGALIAAGVSLTGLLITNQAKVSEFRQEWINSVRNDVATLVACALEIHQADGTNQQKLDSLFIKIQKVTARIVLRLNPREKDSQGIVAAMNNLRSAIHGKTKADFAQVNSLVNALEAVTQVALKKEWGRVKSGEFLYRWTFRVVVAGVVVLAPLFLYEERHQLLDFLFNLK